MRVYGIGMVRNEVDMIRLNILYHLSIGLDRLLIVDNGSSDGTDRVLRRLSKDPRLRWSRDTGPHRQGEILTELAREAHGEGADWVVPIEADGFFYSRRAGIKEVLAGSKAEALRVRIIDFIQRREQRETSPEALLYMTRRVAEPLARDKHVRELAELGRVSYVEMARVPQLISRTSAAIQIAHGAHSIGGSDSLVEKTSEIVLLHAPLPSFARLESKSSLADRASEAIGRRGSWHVRRWQELRKGSGLEREWVANSYKNDCLDVHGTPRSVIFDPTLRDAVKPFIGRPLWKRLAGRY